MPEQKSLGQLAYEAYAGHTGWKSLVSGAPLPDWEAQRVEIQEAWQAAARAVEHQAFLSKGEG